jgi:hypothetical protein
VLTGQMKCYFKSPVTRLNRTWEGLLWVRAFFVPVVSAKATLSGFRSSGQSAASTTVIKSDRGSMLVQNPLCRSRYNTFIPSRVRFKTSALSDKWRGKKVNEKVCYEPQSEQDLPRDLLA